METTLAVMERQQQFDFQKNGVPCQGQAPCGVG